MICEEVPCGCKSKKPKTVRVHVSPDPVESVQTPRESAVQASIRAAAAATKAQEFEQRYMVPPRHRVTRSVTEEVSLHAALRNLESILHPEEKEKYRVILTSAPSLDERSAVWRERRGAPDS